MFPDVRFRIKKFLFGLACVLWASACSTGEDLSQSSPPHTQIVGTLMPYQTVTQKPIKESLTSIPAVNPPPIPTATPYKYTIEEGDTLLGIAFRFGLTLDRLLAANPNIDPQFLRVGSDINIPLVEHHIDGLNEATPVSVVFERPNPHCYRTANGGAWCFLLIRNDLGISVENLTALFTLYDEKGESFLEEVAVSPLNLIKPGSRMPLVLYLEPPLDSIFSTSAQILTGNNVSVEETRYLSSSIDRLGVDISSEGKRARIVGSVLFDSSDWIGEIDTDIMVWVLVVAFGEDGNVAGFRRWEYFGPLDKNRELPFEIFVYSLEPAIEKVEIYVEVQS